MAEIMNRLLSAMNAHDLDAFVACFAADYESQQPAHPSRAFRGSDQVRKTGKASSREFRTSPRSSSCPQ